MRLLTILGFVAIILCLTFGIFDIVLDRMTFATALLFFSAGLNVGSMMMMSYELRRFL
jgi:hypothetical protein